MPLQSCCCFSRQWVSNSFCSAGHIKQKHGRRWDTPGAICAYRIPEFRTFYSSMYAGVVCTKQWNRTNYRLSVCVIFDQHVGISCTSCTRIHGYLFILAAWPFLNCEQTAFGCLALLHAMRVNMHTHTRNALPDIPMTLNSQGPWSASMWWPSSTVGSETLALAGGYQPAAVEHKIDHMLREDLYFKKCKK